MLFGSYHENSRPKPRVFCWNWAKSPLDHGMTSRHCYPFFQPNRSRNSDELVPGMSEPTASLSEDFWCWIQEVATNQDRDLMRFDQTHGATTLGITEKNTSQPPGFLQDFRKTQGLAGSQSPKRSSKQHTVSPILFKNVPLCRIWRKPGKAGLGSGSFKFEARS